MKILVTGGAGFIGSAVVRHIIENTEFSVVNLDKLTYAGNLLSLAPVAQNERYIFYQGDIADKEFVTEVLSETQPDAIMHLAAESHVDRSIDGPDDFIQTNIVGTYVLLECVRAYLTSFPTEKQSNFRFHHISTDEVFGDLADGELFTELTPYNPSSPYSASKAASDHLVKSWHRTFGLPVVLSNCSNNYGPYHFPEKLIPLIILNALEGRQLPIYGNGLQVRDWLYVEDHARALMEVLVNGKLGETYNIGGFNEKTNIEVVLKVCDLLQELLPPLENNLVSVDTYRDLIVHVSDRPGHDVRYAIDASKIKEELGWVPKESFESGIRKTVSWFLENIDWVENTKKDHNRQRLGLNN